MYRDSIPETRQQKNKLQERELHARCGNDDDDENKL